MANFKVINGEIHLTTIPKTGLLPINGEIYPILGVESGDEATPIGYMKYYTGSTNISLPIYNTADVTNNQLRIYTGSVVGCLDLVDTSHTNASAIRFYTGSGVRAIRQA